MGDPVTEYERACRSFNIPSDPVVIGSLQLAGIREVNLAGRLKSDSHAIAAANALCSLWAITKLNIDGSVLAAAGITAIADLIQQLPCLEVFSARSCALGDAGAAMLIDALLTSKQLQRLDLSANSIGVDGATAIAAWLPQSHSLRALILDVNAVGEDGVAALGAAAFAHPRLRELRLNGNRLSDAGTAALCAAIVTSSSQQSTDTDRANSLATLFLCNNAIGDAGCASLARVLPSLPCLTALYLADNRISDAGMAHLAQAPGRLEVLHVWKNRLTDAAGRALGDVLAAGTLRTLHAGFNSFGGRGMHAVAQALRASQLTALNVESALLGDDGGVLLFAALHHCPSMRDLVLSGCALGRASIHACAGYLRGNRGLEQLDLSGNRVGDEGAQLIGAALATNVQLRTLALDDCDVGDAGVVAFSSVAQADKLPLVALSLCTNLFGAVGGAALAVCVRSSSKLKHLVVFNTNIGAEMLAGLRTACSERSVRLSVD